MIAEKRGNMAAARQEYQAAAVLDPKLRQAKEALARLKQESRRLENDAESLRTTLTR